jgi:amyloid beta precursor protein binding protein 1
LQPWRELSDYARFKTENLEGLDDHAHGHVPYLLLLLHYLDVYKASHEGKPPTSYAEKKEFKELVQNGARSKNAEGGEENFDEAVASVLKSLNSPSIAKGLQETFDAEDCRSPGVDVSYNVTLIRS